MPKQHKIEDAPIGKVTEHEGLHMPEMMPMSSKAGLTSIHGMQSFNFVQEMEQVGFEATRKEGGNESSRTSRKCGSGPRTL